MQLRRPFEFRALNCFGFRASNFGFSDALALRRPKSTRRSGACSRDNRRDRWLVAGIPRSTVEYRKAFQAQERLEPAAVHGGHAAGHRPAPDVGIWPRGSPAGASAGHHAREPAVSAADGPHTAGASAENRRLGVLSLSAT